MIGGMTTRLYAPQDLRTEDPRPQQQSFDEWAPRAAALSVADHFGGDRDALVDVLQMLGLMAAPVASSYDPFTHSHMFTCTVCGKRRQGRSEGVCQYCRSVDTRGQEHRQGV